MKQIIGAIVGAGLLAFAVEAFESVALTAALSPAITLVAAAIGAGVGALMGPHLQTEVADPGLAAQQAASAREQWAARQGLRALRDAAPYDDPAYLAQGYSQRADDAFRGVLVAGVEGAVYNHTWFERATQTVVFGEEGDPIWTPHPLTVVRADLPLGIAGVSLRVRGLADVLDDQLAAAGARRVVRLESVEFDEAFVLTAPTGWDDVLLRAVFAPDAMVALLDARGAFARVEFGHTGIAFVRPGRFSADDAAGLAEVDPLLDAARHVLAQLAAGRTTGMAGTVLP